MSNPADSRTPIPLLSPLLELTPPLPILTPPTPVIPRRSARLQGQDPIMFNPQIQDSLDNLNISIAALAESAENKTTQVSPPPFKGGKEEDVLQFLRVYNKIAHLNGWNDDRKIQHLFVSFQGDASRWLTAQLVDDTERSWESWQNLIKATFHTQNFKELAHIRLQNRFQLPSEEAEAYFHDVVRLCDRVNTNMPAEDKLRHIMKGFQPEVLQKLMIMSPVSTEDVLNKLRQLSRMDLMLKANICTQNGAALRQSLPGHQFGSNAPTSIAAMAAALQEASAAAPPEFDTYARLMEAIERLERQLRQERDTRNPFPPRGNRNESGQIQCFRCLKFGHIGRQCRAPFPRQEQGGARYYYPDGPGASRPPYSPQDARSPSPVPSNSTVPKNLNPQA